jgi:hypothetical protein
MVHSESWPFLCYGYKLTTTSIHIFKCSQGDTNVGDLGSLDEECWEGHGEPLENL